MSTDNAPHSFLRQMDVIALEPNHRMACYYESVVDLPRLMCDIRYQNHQNRAGTSSGTVAAAENVPEAVSTTTQAASYSVKRRYPLVIYSRERMEMAILSIFLKKKTIARAKPRITLTTSHITRRSSLPLNNPSLGCSGCRVKPGLNPRYGRLGLLVDRVSRGGTNKVRKV